MGKPIGGGQSKSFSVVLGVSLMTVSDVFIVGAGPAGLTASYLLTKEGVSTTVIEADPVYVGGISRTANYKEFLFDIGGHRFFSKSKEVGDLWKEILPQDLIERPRLSRIYYDGKYYSYPLKAFEALNNLASVLKTQCRLVMALHYFHAAWRIRPEDASIQNNLVHGSDSPENAEIEIALWFKPDEQVSWAPVDQAWVVGS